MKYKLFALALLLPTYNSHAQPMLTEMDKTSYSLGVKTGQHYHKQAIELNPQSFQEGILAGLHNKTPALSEQEMQQLLTKLQENQLAKSQVQAAAVAQENLQKGKEFLANNKKNKDIISLPSGLQYKIITAGKGTAPTLTDIVTVNYRGTLLDGTEFDSSYKRNESATLPVNNLIKGWQEALTLMSPGAKWKLFIPAELAYGEQASGIIQPNSTLIFDIELLNVLPKK